MKFTGVTFMGYITQLKQPKSKKMILLSDITELLKLWRCTAKVLSIVFSCVMFSAHEDRAIVFNRHVSAIYINSLLSLDHSLILYSTEMMSLWHPARFYVRLSHTVLKYCVTVYLMVSLHTVHVYRWVFSNYKKCYQIIHFSYYLIMVIGIITRPSCRPHSIAPLARPSLSPARARNWKTKKRRKIKNGIDVSHDTSKWSANFQFERSKVKVTGRKNLKKSCVIFT